MKQAKTGGVMTDGQLLLALRKRYPAAEYALLEQVRNSTGFSRQPRTADAIALSLWPSRGLHLHGFEIKSYRGDWKREQAAPEKADEIARFCDFWWLTITDARIVELGELPPTWGLLAPDDKATRLVVVREATKMEPQPWSRGFMAAVLRKAGDTMVTSRLVKAQIEQARLEGLAQGQGLSPATETERELKRLRELETRVQAFEAASGLSLQHGWNEPRQVGEAVQAVLRGRAAHQQLLTHVKRLSDNLPSFLDRPIANLQRTAQATSATLGECARQLEALTQHPKGDPPC